MLPTRLPTSLNNRSKRNGRRFRNYFNRFSVIPAVKTGVGQHVFPVFLFLLFLFLVNNLFTITKTDCILDSETCSPEIVQKLNKYIGSNVLLLNQKQITKSIVDSFSVEKVSLGFKMFNTLKVVLEGSRPPLPVLVYVVKDLPTVSVDTALGSSTSADWPRPSSEFDLFVEAASPSGFGLWDNGRMIPVATTESQIKYLLSEKPDEETVKSLYRLIKMVNKYLDIKSIQILGQRVFLSQSGQPDIIVSVPFDEGRVSEAIKSYTYLAALKKDAKVIDLRFKNPIIR